MMENEKYRPPETKPFDTIELDPKSAKQIEELALKLPQGIYADSFQKRGDFIEAAQNITRALEKSNLGPALQELKGGKRVALTITGLPRDPELPPAPIDGRSPKGKKTFVSEGIACGVANSLGYPSLILTEKEEALVHQITPVPGKEQSQSNEGSVPLKLHQDLAPNPEMPSMSYHQFMPDYLILTGVQKGSGDTPTYIASIDDAIPKLNPKTIKILQQERFITDPPYSFGKTPSPDKLPIHSVVSERDGHFESAFDISSNLRPRDKRDRKAANAILELHRALLEVKQEVAIEPGTAVVFNNRRVVHGRGAVTKEQNNLGDKRWIQRVYIFNTERVVKEALKDHLRIQMGGGLLRVTALAAPDLRPEFERLLKE